MVHREIKKRDIYERHKLEPTSHISSLQHLSTPQRVWEDVSIDITKGLPLSKGKTVILIVLNKLSKYAHFFGHLPPLHCLKSYPALHRGHLQPVWGAIVDYSNDNAIFTSARWQEHMKLEPDRPPPVGNRTTSQ